MAPNRTSAWFKVNNEHISSERCLINMHFSTLTGFDLFDLTSFFTLSTSNKTTNQLTLDVAILEWPIVFLGSWLVTAHLSVYYSFAAHYILVNYSLTIEDHKKVWGWLWRNSTTQILCCNQRDSDAVLSRDLDVSKTKTYWSKMKIHWSKTKSQRSKTKTHWPGLKRRPTALV